MQIPKGLQVNEQNAKWFYQELVIRFGEYKEPIRTVREVAASFHMNWWDVVHIVRMDRNHTFLDTDEEHVWAVNRCSKLVKA